LTYSGPNQELLDLYGTDEIYFSNLEKRADTQFSIPMAAATAGEWGRLLTARGLQEKVDKQRLHAQALNMQFRQLEAQRNQDTVENLGGPGTVRQQYQRQMLTHPYMLHPMMAGAAMQGTGPGPEERMVTASAQRCGALMAKVAFQNLPELPPVEPDMGGQMPKSLAAPHLQAAKQHVGQALGEVAVGGGHVLGESSGRLGTRMGDTAGRLGTRLGDASMALGSRIQKSPGLIRRVAGIPGNLFGGFARGVENFMSGEVQPTVRWGTGIHPASNVNEYGIAIGGGGY
jgi:hypothetical protein